MLVFWLRLLRRIGVIEQLRARNGVRRDRWRRPRTGLLARNNFRLARHSGAIPRIAVVSREEDRFYVSPPYVSGPSEGSHAALTGALFLKLEH